MAEETSSSAEYSRQNSTLMQHEDFKSNGLPEDFIFCSVFLQTVGGMERKKVLDLGCGAGYYSRKVKGLGAELVVGVDKSTDMLTAARMKESEAKCGIQYVENDVVDYLHQDDESNQQTFFDVVTAAFLLQFAESKEVLRSFCQTAYNNLLAGGRFVALSNGDFNEKNIGEDYVELYGWECEIVSEGENVEDLIKDGRRMRTTLYSAERKVHCVFNDYVWSFATIKQLLQDVGFSHVEKVSVCGTMVMVISATK